MIELWDVYEKCKVWVNASNIKEVQDKPYHHGQKCRVLLFDGRAIETSREPSEVLAAIGADSR